MHEGRTSSTSARSVDWYGAVPAAGVVAGEEGLEPSNAGTKIRCLTTWRLPNFRTTDNATAHAPLWHFLCVGQCLPPASREGRPTWRSGRSVYWHSTMDITPQALVLAAGRGQRMRSATGKMLHRLEGKTLVEHTTGIVVAAGCTPVVIVPAGDMSTFRGLLGESTRLVEQQIAQGTGDAARSVPPRLRSKGAVVVLNGDAPLVRPETIRALVERLATHNVDAVVATVSHVDGREMGSLERGADRTIVGIQEAADRQGLGGNMGDGSNSDSSLEYNVGVYAFRGEALWPALDQLKAANAQGEYYLTDVIAVLSPRVEAFALEDISEGRGINDRKDLAAAAAVLRTRTCERLMNEGVTIVDPATTYIDTSVVIGQDTVIAPLTVITGSTRIGERCTIGPSARIANTVIGDAVTIGASAIDDSTLDDDVVVGEWSRLRPNCHIHQGAYIGTHAELKNSDIGAGTQVAHFSCVLDSTVGERVNVGAGTVTCNFDGIDKQRITIGNDVFVGSDATLVAPLTLGDGSYVAAGSVITSSVEAGALAVGRSRQRDIAGWAAARRVRQEQMPTAEHMDGGGT